MLNEINWAYLKKRVGSFLKRRVMVSPVSVIVPVYNSEDTMRKCLDSLIDQSQKRIRIICVNDGSSDRTLEILKEYKRRYWKIKIINQKNGGRSAARNSGLNAVRTKFVMFCDSDDWYEKEMCENMVDAIEKSRADLAVCGLNMIYKAHEEMKESDEEYYKIRFNGLKEIDDEIILTTDSSVCNKIFRTEIIKKHNICFPDGLNNEDFYFYNAYMSVAKSIYFVDQRLYNYIRHEGSIMSSNFAADKKSLDHLIVAEKLFNFYKKTGFLKQHKELFWRQWIASFWFSYRSSDKKYYSQIGKEARRFLNDYFEEYRPSESELIKWKDDIVKTINKIGKDKNGRK